MFNLIEQINKNAMGNEKNLKRKNDDLLYSQQSRFKFQKVEEQPIKTEIDSVKLNTSFFNIDEQQKTKEINEFISNVQKNATIKINSLKSKKYRNEENEKSIFEDNKNFSFQTTQTSTSSNEKIRNTNGRFGKINNITKK